MAKGISDRVATLLEASTKRRVLVTGLAVSIATTAYSSWNWIAAQLALRGMSAPLGIPAWCVALIVLLVCASYFLFEYAHRLRISLTPKFKVHEFDIDSLGMVTAVEMARDQHDNPVSIEAIYLRLTVENESKSVIERCRAYVVALAKKPDGVAAFVPVALPQPIFLNEPFDLYPEIPHMVDFVKSWDLTNEMYVTGAWPFALRKAFAGKGTYRFTIAVHAGGVTEKRVVDVNWRGEWNGITASHA